MPNYSAFYLCQRRKGWPGNRGSRESESESTDWSEGHRRGITKAVTSRRASKKNNDNFQTNGYLEAEAKMKRILTDKRRDKLADYSLNISVASFAVAAFDHNWWGVLPAVVGLALFFFLTKEA